MTLYIPYNYPFVLDEATSRFITQYVDYDDVEGNTWIMTENGLTCQTCPKSESESDSDEDNDDSNNTSSRLSEQFGINDFDGLDIHGIFDVRIIAGNEYAIELLGPDRERSKYDIYRKGRDLVIKFEGRNRKFEWKEGFHETNDVQINITMPSLRRIEAQGVGSLKFDEFTVDDLEIDLRGPIKLRGYITAHNLHVDLTGAAEAEISGEVNTLDADVQFASKLQAYDLEANDATIEATGASSAKVNVSHSIQMEERAASDIDYRGNPEIVRKD
jgi:hypothetical protein